MSEKTLMKKEDSLWIAENMLINYCLWDEDALMIESFIKNLNIPIEFDPDHFHFCIFGPDKRFTQHWNKETLSQGVDRTCHNYEQVQKILHEAHYRGNCFLIKVDNTKKMAVIFSPMQDPLCTPLQIAEKFHQIPHGIKSSLMRYVTTSLVCDYHGYESIHKAFQRAQQLNDLYFFRAFDTVITEELLKTITFDCTLSAIDENVRKLRNLICEASLADIENQIDTLFLTIVANSYNYTYFETAYALCNVIIHLLINVYDLDIAEETPDMKALYAIEDYVYYLKKTIAAILSLIDKRNRYSYRILAAMAFIKNNYQKDISLQIIAEYLSINPTSLSSDFNRETGHSISDFISRCRIQAAEKMLLETNEPINLIAQKVGFTNPKYFSQIFREIHQVSPLQYRKSF